MSVEFVWPLIELFVWRCHEKVCLCVCVCVCVCYTDYEAVHVLYQ